MAEAQGRVVSDRFPYLPIRLSLGGRTDDLEALLDTGFDGALAVPRGFVDTAQVPDGYQLWALADGSEVRSPVYVGTAQLGPFGPFRVAVTVVGDEPILGREVSDRFRIILEYGRQVIAEH